MVGISKQMLMAKGRKQFNVIENLGRMINSKKSEQASDLKKDVPTSESSETETDK